MKEEELQHQIEKGHSDDSLDGMAYKKVFDALKSEPSFSLKHNFADTILSIIEKKEAKEKSFDRWMLLVGIVGFVAATVVAVLLSNFKLSAGAFRFISNYMPLILFGAGFVLMLQWAEKKLSHKTS